MRELPKLVDRHATPNRYSILPEHAGVLRTVEGPVSPRFYFARLLKADTRKLKSGPTLQGGVIIAS